MSKEHALASEKQMSLPTSLDALLSHFYQRPEHLAEFRPCLSGALPPIATRLLDHDRHMTEALESYYGRPVTVEVVRSFSENHLYAREILLRCPSDRGVVQYGIVWLDRRAFPGDVMREIEAEEQPLGKILIDFDVLREVTLKDLYKVTLGPALGCFFGGRAGNITYGRTAAITCHQEPAIFLLEVLSHRPFQGATGG